MEKRPIFWEVVILKERAIGIGVSFNFTAVDLLQVLSVLYVIGKCRVSEKQPG